MKNARKIIVVLLLIAAAAGGWYYYTHASAATDTLTASGTVETTEIAIAPEISGRITAINVQEGDMVKAGDVLFRLDDTLLQAQRNVAVAGLESAKAAAATAGVTVASAQTQFDNALNIALTQEKSTRTSSWYKNQPGEFTLPLWYYDQNEQLGAAQNAVDVAQAALKAAQDRLTAVETQSAGADFVKTETALVNAQANYQVANDLNNRVKNGKNIDELTQRQIFLIARDAMIQAKRADGTLMNEKWWLSVSNIDKDLRNEAKKIFEDAKQSLDDAQTAYDDAIGTDGAKDVLKVRAQMSIARERYYTALDYLRILQTGAASPTVTVAQNALDQANAAATQAENAVKQAQANLDLLDAQIAKTIVVASVEGVVLTRAGEPGSVVNAGGTVLTVGRLDELTITVYVPENRMGEVSLGQSAGVMVDSFSGETFTGTVTFIANQAEFTPRNVQTVEGRKNTVFAVKLKLEDVSGKLKPGMPADVSFDPK